MSAAVTETAT
jgi:hypothetical protein